MSDNKPVAVAKEIQLNTPEGIIKFADDLKSIIVKRKLYTEIRGKNYVNVEGWQIAGAFTGAIPIVEKVEDLSSGSTYKYRAEVSLRDKDGNKVGYGVALCSNKEAKKRTFDEYAVASMAQTRAIGKAYRAKLGWLLKIAGYETTPAEEMPDEREPEISEMEKAKIKLILNNAKTIADIENIVAKYPQIYRSRELLDYKEKMEVQIERSEI